MLKVVLLPLLTVFGGMCGFFLRRWELATAFESTGLVTPWMPATVILIVLSVALAAAIILLCRKPKNELNGYDDAFSAQGSRLYLAVLALASACLLVAALFGLKAELFSWPRSILRLLLWVLCVASFFCVLRNALNNFRRTTGKYSTALLIPAYTLCLWLVSSYQQYAADPVILNYVYRLLAIICSLLGLYFTAAFSFARPKFRRCAVFSLMGIYFSIVTLADSHTLADHLLYLFIILYQLANVTALLRHAFFTQPKHIKNEMNNTQEVTPDE